MNRYIFVTGGVLSSLGKGITAGGIAALLESQGLKVSLLKLDPYLNIDPGTMSPYEHGEVFVTDDGAEADLDLGHYERFSTVPLGKENSVSTGQLYAQLLDKERKGTFLGRTIQIVPHLTNEIKEAIYKVRDAADVTIVEIGGTVGDIEGLPLIEAIRQINLDRTNNRCVFVHVTYVPYIEITKELKTKPTQHSVKQLLSLGIQPHIIIGRAVTPLPEDIKKKIALFTNVDEEAVFSAPDLKSVYEMPVALHHQQFDTILDGYLDLPKKKPDLKTWQSIIDHLYTPHKKITIAIVGKYTEQPDAYKSIREALTHAQIPNDVAVGITWINAEEITKDTVAQKLAGADAVLVPGGFGKRGIDGMITAIAYARENKIPFLGICLGMQLASIECARHVLGIKDADSKEFNEATPSPLIDMMAEQKTKTLMGGTMRLGAYSCDLKKGSRARQIYGGNTISERHRHRYELNTAYVPQFEKHGFIVTGYHKNILPEIIEIPEHPFFVGVQFHPEFKSKPFAPHPLFVAFVKAAKEHKQ